MGMSMGVETDGIVLSGFDGWEGWSFHVTHDGRSVTVTPPPGGAITRSKWQRIPIEAILNAVAGRTTDVWLNLLTARAAASASGGRDRPRGGSTAHQDLVAYLYREALKRRIKPKAAIEAHFGVSANTIEAWLKEVRAVGKLGSYESEREAALAEAQLWEDAGMAFGNDGFPGGKES